jgi:hypothetical protein
MVKYEYPLSGQKEPYSINWTLIAGGAYHKIDLIQGINVRDHFDGSFATQTLNTSRFSSLDVGSAGQPFIAAATVAASPARDLRTHARRFVPCRLLGSPTEQIPVAMCKRTRGITGR